MKTVISCLVAMLLALLFCLVTSCKKKDKPSPQTITFELSKGNANLFLYSNDLFTDFADAKEGFKVSAKYVNGRLYSLQSDSTATLSIYLDNKLVAKGIKSVTYK